MVSEVDLFQDNGSLAASKVAERMMTDVNDGYHFFWSGPFSQWKRSIFDLDGVEFNTAEQAMMHGKAMLFGDQDIADKIMATRDARKQKALGRQVKGFDATVWTDNCQGIVRCANLAKFRQNKGLRRKLFQTCDRLLVEASALDTIWGIGLSEDDARQTPQSDWPGQNLLGKILTDVRDVLKGEFSEEASSVQTDAEVNTD